MMNTAVLPQRWAVSVNRDGENIVTIESNCVSGRDLTPEDEQCIENCAHHLLAFLGRPMGGRVFRLGDRRVRVSRMPDGSICRDHRGRIAVRNVETNRLSYVRESRLVKREAPHD